MLLCNKQTALKLLACSTTITEIAHNFAVLGGDSLIAKVNQWLGEKWWQELESPDSWNTNTSDDDAAYHLDSLAGMPTYDTPQSDPVSFDECN